MHKFRVGKLYELEFKDHTIGIKTPMDCKAVGYVIEDHKEYVLFSSWVVKTDDRDVFNNNLENFVVLKNCIKSKRLIK